MSEWQPIETAPKDGSDVLLSNGYWTFEATSLPDGRFIRTKDRQQTAPSNCKFWMPLPEPPGEVAYCGGMLIPGDALRE